MSAYCFMRDELLKIAAFPPPMQPMQQPGLAHTMSPQAQPSIQPPKRSMPHTKLAPRPASTGAAHVAKVPKPAKLPGVFGKAMRGAGKVI